MPAMFTARSGASGRVKLSEEDKLPPQNVTHWRARFIHLCHCAAHHARNITAPPLNERTNAFLIQRRNTKCAFLGEMHLFRTPSIQWESAKMCLYTESWWIEEHNNNSDGNHQCR